MGAIIAAVSPEDFGALLTLIGLLAEVGAVIAILIAVGVPERLGEKARTAFRKVAVRPYRRLRAFLARHLPWVQPKTVDGSATLSGRGRASAGGSMGLTTRVGAPKDLQEVADQLDALRQMLDAQNDAMREEAEALRAEIAANDRTSAQRADEIHTRMEEEARRVLGERTREGMILALGIALQVVGAAAILLDWSPV